MSHDCPVRRCTIKRLPDKYLMCGRHWRMVPAADQAEVWDYYAGGAGVLPNGLPSPQLAEAQLRAIRAVEAIERAAP